MSSLLYYERNLPHRLPPGSPIFLTFRLANSLPASEIARLQAQFTSVGPEATADSYAQQRRYFGRFDELLDTGGYGPTWLAEPLVAAVVSRSLHHFHGTAYTLLCYCLMPNHVHLVVLIPDDAPPLAETLQRLKGYTALQANKVLGRTGQFW